MILVTISPLTTAASTRQNIRSDFTKRFLIRSNISVNHFSWHKLWRVKRPVC